jgi:hypothetical protein
VDNKNIGYLPERSCSWACVLSFIQKIEKIHGTVPYLYSTTGISRAACSGSGGIRNFIGVHGSGSNIIDKDPPSEIFGSGTTTRDTDTLKVLSSEKRGGLTVVPSIRKVSL